MPYSGWCVNKPGDGNADGKRNWDKYRGVDEVPSSKATSRCGGSPAKALVGGPGESQPGFLSLPTATPGLGDGNMDVSKCGSVEAHPSPAGGIELAKEVVPCSQDAKRRIHQNEGISFSYMSGSSVWMKRTGCRHETRSANQ